MDITAIVQRIREFYREHTVTEPVSIEKTVRDAVVVDLGMLEMDGRAVARAVKSISPKTRVLLLTGWGRTSEIMATIPGEVDALVEKPVQEKVLLRALSHVIAPPE